MRATSPADPHARMLASTTRDGTCADPVFQRWVRRGKKVVLFFGNVAMPDWFDTKSMALSSAETSLNTVDELLTLVKDGRGKPSEKERAVFAGAVVFLYGIWENFVEQLAIELVTHLSPPYRPHKGSRAGSEIA